MNKIPKPNYTQVPNAILDNMGSMGNAEFRVVAAVARKTFGWQKQTDRISLSQLVTLTGLSRQGVIDGTQDAVDNGWLEKTPCGNSFEYTLIVNQIDQEEGSQASRLETVKQVDQEVVKPVDTQKKELNKTKETIVRSRAPLPDELLITSIQHGQELQSELSKAFESKNRKAPTHFENIQQKEQYQKCATSLNGRFLEAVTNTIGRGRIGRGDLLSSLQAWVKNDIRDGKTNDHANYQPTSRKNSIGNEVSPEGLDFARRLSGK